jgi:CRP/FNR family cyclic AMP-dependent transcriptional regulator
VEENQRVDTLKAIQLFSTLSSDELAEVGRRVSKKRFKKNEVILYEEDTNEFIYMILEGGVKVVQTSEDGKETILAMHQPSDFFGEMTLIDGKTVPATVVATEDSQVAIISRKDFKSMLYGQNKVLERLLEILCGRLRESWDKIKILTYKDASLRIKMLFVMLSGEYGEKTPEGVTLKVKLTHQSVADMTGLARETVTRVLDRWQKDGEISVLKNKYILLGPDFMRKDLKGV